MPLLEDNLSKGKQLHVKAQWAFEAWVRECFTLNLQFRVTETFRTQERQNELYKIGRRGVPGEKPVTWTLNSEHTYRIAADCYPINCTHKQLETIAAKYGIAHPWPTNDPPHYSFGSLLDVASELTPEQRLAQAQKALKWAKGLRLFALQNLIGRLKTMLGVY